MAPPVPFPIGAQFASKLKGPTGSPYGATPFGMSNLSPPPSLHAAYRGAPIGTAPNQPVLVTNPAPTKAAPYTAPVNPTAAPANPETNPSAPAPTLATLGERAPEVIYRGTVTGAGVLPISLPTTSDYRTLVIRMDVSVTSGATAVPATDILNALSNLEVDDPSGKIVSLTPVEDFYALYLRYSRYHSSLVPTKLTGTASSEVTVSASYELPGFRISQSGGPYTLVLTTPTAAGGFGANATALSTLFTITAVPGLTGGVTFHAIHATLNPQLVAGGYSDYAPTFPFQGMPLDELYLTGLTSNTQDVSFWSIILNGTLVTNRVYSSDLVAQAQGRMTGTIPSGTLYLCYPLGTQIALNRSSHLWASMGTNPATSGVSATAVWYA